MLLWKNSKANIIIAFAGDYTIKIFSPEPKLLRSIKHEGKRVKVTDEDKESYFAAMVSSVGGQQSKAVFIFGPDGSFIRKLGRQGQGPGEFVVGLPRI